jgi:16S rRNA (guanine(966)-N(2))-methyltransferase RsmD
MRVIAGTAKSLRLVAPSGTATRPTSDAVRESLFSMLGDVIPEGPFLDVYAGSGAVGIEALSRGAEHCVFIERDRRGVEAIRRNLENTHLTERATVMQGEAQRLVGRATADHGPYAVIFLDPPYDDPQALSLAAGLLRPEALAAGGLLVLQHARRAKPADLPPPLRVREFGETALSFYSAPDKEP